VRLVECPLNQKTGVAVAKLIGKRERPFKVFDHLAAFSR
jgi:hypothetical protein